MPLLETLTLAPIAAGAIAILRFVWLDSLRFADVRVVRRDESTLSAPTAERLALQAAAARIVAQAEFENDRLPKAA